MTDFAAPQTTSPIDELFNLLFYAGDQDPGQKSTNNYQSEDQKLNFIGDVLYRTGLSVEDLLGMMPAPEDPGAAPVFTEQAFQSDLRGVHGANPYLMQAFDAVESGSASPFEAAKTAVLLAKEAGEEGYLPALTPEFAGQPGGVDEQAVADIVLQYAGDVARGSREGSQLLAEQQAELDAYNQQKQAYDRFMLPGTALDEFGNPTVQQFQEAGGSDVAQENIDRFEKFNRSLQQYQEQLAARPTPQTVETVPGQPGSGPAQATSSRRTTPEELAAAQASPGWFEADPNRVRPTLPEAPRTGIDRIGLPLSRALPDGPLPGMVTRQEAAPNLAGLQIRDSDLLRQQAGRGRQTQSDPVSTEYGEAYKKELDRLLAGKHQELASTPTPSGRDQRSAAYLKLINALTTQ